MAKFWHPRESRTSAATAWAFYHHQHTAVVDALRDRDAGGGTETMREHRQTVSDNFLGWH
jgi:DNA-binding GntR family transcriptional regulator